MSSQWGGDTAHHPPNPAFLSRSQQTPGTRTPLTRPPFPVITASLCSLRPPHRGPEFSPCLHLGPLLSSHSSQSQRPALPQALRALLPLAYRSQSCCVFFKRANLILFLPSLALPEPSTFRDTRVIKPSPACLSRSISVLLSRSRLPAASACKARPLFPS